MCPRRPGRLPDLADGGDDQYVMHGVVASRGRRGFSCRFHRRPAPDVMGRPVNLPAAGRSAGRADDATVLAADRLGFHARLDHVGGQFTQFHVPRL